MGNTCNFSISQESLPDNLNDLSNLFKGNEFLRRSNELAIRYKFVTTYGQVTGTTLSWGLRNLAGLTVSADGDLYRIQVTEGGIDIVSENSLFWSGSIDPYNRFVVLKQDPTRLVIYDVRTDGYLRFKLGFYTNRLYPIRISGRNLIYDTCYSNDLYQDIEFSLLVSYPTSGAISPQLASFLIDYQNLFINGQAYSNEGWYISYTSQVCNSDLTHPVCNIFCQQNNCAIGYANFCENNLTDIKCIEYTTSARPNQEKREVASLYTSRCATSDNRFSKFCRNISSITPDIYASSYREGCQSIYWEERSRLDTILGRIRQLQLVPQDTRVQQLIDRELSLSGYTTIQQIQTRINEIDSVCGCLYSDQQNQILLSNLFPNRAGQDTFFRNNPYNETCFLPSCYRNADAYKLQATLVGDQYRINCPTAACIQNITTQDGKIAAGGNISISNVCRLDQ